jgi:cytosine/adenosine deaminase-related metal-dependent hydrolase
LADQQPVLLRVDARAFADHRGALPRTTSALIELRPRGERRLRLVAIGPGAEIDRHPGAGAARRIDRRGFVIVPGLVNAHTHLDLTHIGPVAHDPGDGFMAWVDRIRHGRLADEAGIEQSVHRGAELCLAGGVVAVGDVGGAPAGHCSLAPLRGLRASGLIGVSYLEYFGIGRGETGARERVKAAVDAATGAGGGRRPLRAAVGGTPVEEGGVRLGLQPHASNTIGIDLYRWSAELAGRRGLPICTHLAETPEEREFVARGTGPQRAFLERLGLWDDRVLEDVGRGETPVGRLAPVIGAGLRTLVHVNGASDADIEVLARAGATVIYCPRASAYFGAERALGPHRYREMLAAGVNVALGTDSLVNLPPEAGTSGISTWDEMKLLYEREGVEPAALLAMATVAGARAIGLDESRFEFEAGSEPAGFVAVRVEGYRQETEALAAALGGDGRPELLLNGKISDLAEISAL